MFNYIKTQSIPRSQIHFKVMICDFVQNDICVRTNFGLNINIDISYYPLCKRCYG